MNDLYDHMPVHKPNYRLGSLDVTYLKRVLGVKMQTMNLAIMVRLDAIHLSWDKKHQLLVTG